jgi:PEGA domain
MTPYFGNPPVRGDGVLARIMPALTTPIACAAVAFVLALNIGCATIVKGTTAKIPVASDPTAADILVDGSLVGQTPTTVVLKKTTDHLVTIQKVGYQPKSVPVVKTVGGAVWGNILAGGLIGWGVDASNGAQYNLIPTTIAVKLDPLTSVALGTGAEDSAAFVNKLSALDQLHDRKALSDEEYVKGRVELFKHYMPEALPSVDASRGK